MQQLARKDRRARGFTLVELLVVIVVLAVLAAIVLPKFMDAGKRAKESALKSNLRELRSQITVFHTDTGYYPVTLADLAATTPPAKGLDSAGIQQDIASADWHGPYIEAVPPYPITGSDWKYSTTAPTVGQIKAAPPYDTL